MWDTVIDVRPAGALLSHDRPCVRCGHALHTFLPCGEGCDCSVVVLPGELAA